MFEMSDGEIFFIVVCLATSSTAALYGCLRRSKGSRASGLDRVLFSWGAADQFTVRDLLNGGVAVFGRSGSGKTSSSGKRIGRAVVNARSGGLILAAKPDDAVMWGAIFKAARREHDLIVFEPRNHWRFNFLDYEMQAGGHTRNITRCIKTIGETLRSSDTKGGGEEGDFWEQQQERVIYNAVEIVKVATGRVTAPDLQRFITTAAYSMQMLDSEQWRAQFHNQCLGAAFKRVNAGIEKYDYDLALDFWLAEFPQMADKTRSSILAGVMGILHVFNTGIVREMVSTTTNITPDAMFEGKWILVNMAPSEYGDLGSFVAAGWKYLAQRRNLRRHVTSRDSICVIWCDEAQQFVNSFDAQYLAQCRSHMGCMVYLTQSLHSYYAALKGMAGRHQAEALLSNFHTKIIHALGDAQSAEWASALVGKSLQTFVGGSTPPEDDMFGAMMGMTRFSGSFSEHIESIVQPREFMNGLRTGGPPSYVCDAIAIRSGEPFSTGDNWMPVAFSQR